MSSQKFELDRFKNIEIIPQGPAQPQNQLELAKKIRDNKIYEALQEHTLNEAVESFLTILKPSTARAYKSSLKWLAKRDILNFDQKLSEFALVNYAQTLGEIKKHASTTSSRQSRAAAFISLTKYLNSRSNSLIPRCHPVTSGIERTFGKVYDKGRTKPLSRVEAKQLLDILKTINFATYIFAFIALNSGRRSSEVLALRWEDINFDKKQISFVVKKLSFEKIVAITYSDGLFEDLRLLKRCNSYSSPSSPVFMRTNGAPISYAAVWNRFRKASSMLGKQVTPHCLRSTFVSIASEEGHAHTDIQSCTGHQSLSMISYYDHTSEQGELSKKFSIV